MGAFQSFGLTLVAFVVLISVIVFVHELGHLLVGKWLGVKALRFSIGFGPKLWSMQWGETEYRLSALPLGGYVKFAGDNPHEELAPEDRGRGFLEQPAGVKALVAFAGPAFNFVGAFVLFLALNLAPHLDMQAAVGAVKPGSPAAQAGLRYGDKIVSIDGEPVSGWISFSERVRASAGRTLNVVVEREGQPRSVLVTPALHEETNPVETTKFGRVGITSSARAAQVAVLSSDSPAARAGLQSFDLVTRVDGQPVRAYEDLVDKLRGKREAELQFLRRRPVDVPGGTFWVQEPRTAKVTRGESVSIPFVDPADEAAHWGLEGTDATVFAVKPGSAAEKAGLRTGDRIVALDGKPVTWWDDVEPARKKLADKPFQLTVRRDGKLQDVTVTQKMRAGRDEAGVRVQIPELGAFPDYVRGIDPELVSVRYPVLDAVRRSALETVGAVRVLSLGLAKILTGRISSEAIGGPIMIADVARRAADDGWRSFLGIMAIISVNLGVMNLLPLPILDGFHILSSGIEAVRRRPLSVRAREIANMVGLVLVVSLMLFAFRNDVMRTFFE